MIAGNIESLLYMPAYGLATLDGLNWAIFGKGDIPTVRKVAFLSSAYGVVIMSLLGIVLYFGAPILLSYSPKTLKQFIKSSSP